MFAYGTTADSLMSTSECSKPHVSKPWSSLLLRWSRYLEQSTYENQPPKPGMLGSLDCMHLRCEKCPKDLQWQYQGHVKKPTIILEAVALHELWICHVFFGILGSHNDINMLHRSPLFVRLIGGKTPLCHYTVNGHEYNMGYCLIDSICPPCATFVNTISNPVGQKKAPFVQRQEAARKDVEKAFEVLPARFAVVQGPTK